LVRIGIAIRTVNARSIRCPLLPAVSVITWGNEESDGIGRDNPRSAGDALSVAGTRGGFGSGCLATLALLLILAPDA
jgi:hypothetical protein